MFQCAWRINYALTYSVQSAQAHHFRHSTSFKCVLGFPNWCSMNKSVRKTLLVENIWTVKITDGIPKMKLNVPRFRERTASLRPIQAQNVSPPSDLTSVCLPDFCSTEERWGGGSGGGPYELIVHRCHWYQERGLILYTCFKILCDPVNVKQSLYFLSAEKI